MRDHKPDAIDKVVHRALEAMQKNVVDEERFEKEEKRQKKIDERHKRLGRLRSEGINNVLPPNCIEKIVTDTLEEKHSLTVVRYWMETELPFIFLTGPTGIGKTVAGAWMIANFGGLFLRAQGLEKAGVAVYGPYTALLERAYNERFVFVDDLDTEITPSDFVLILAEFINNRVGGRLKTIFTSNLNKGRLEERYFSKRELSRLAGAAYIADDSGDMRLRDAEQG